MLAQYMLWPCVCLSQVGVLLKWINTGSQTKAHDSAQGLLVSGAKDLWNSTGVTPYTQAGWVEIGHFRQIAGYISKTAQDRRTVSIKVE